jgi:hypothetical protein
VQAFPGGTPPRYLQQDRDRIYGDVLRVQVANRKITEALTAPLSPWQSPYVEQLIGSIRRECLEHVVVMKESSLHRQIAPHIDHPHRLRCYFKVSLPDLRGNGKTTSPLVMAHIAAGQRFGVIVEFYFGNASWARRQN